MTQISELILVGAHNYDNQLIEKLSRLVTRNRKRFGELSVYAMDRLDVAVKRYNKTPGAKILVTAEKLGTSPRPLNEMATEYLMKLGVHEQDIIRDTTAKHTYDEVKISKQIVGALKPKLLHVITSAEHTARMAILISRLHNSNVSFTMVHHRQPQFKLHLIQTEPGKIRYFNKNGITIDGIKYDSPQECDALADAVKDKNYSEIKRLIPKMFAGNTKVRGVTASARRGKRPKVF